MCQVEVQKVKQRCQAAVWRAAVYFNPWHAPHLLGHHPFQTERDGAWEEKDRSLYSRQPETSHPRDWGGAAWVKPHLASRVINTPRVPVGRAGSHSSKWWRASEVPLQCLPVSLAEASVFSSLIHCPSVTVASKPSWRHLQEPYLVLMGMHFCLSTVPACAQIWPSFCRAWPTHLDF